MAKSFKFKNSTFLDSTGITHNKKILAEILKDTISYKGTLTNNTDLNTIQDTGFYYISDATLVNAPNVSKKMYNWCILIVLNKNLITQIIIKPVDAYLAFREYSGAPGKWYDWKYLSLVSSL